MKEVIKREIGNSLKLNARLHKVIERRHKDEYSVNTKNWYRKGTDLWAEFGKEAPFGKKIFSNDSVKIFAIGSTPSFGKRTVCS
jgi:hypothetical protein